MQAKKILTIKEWSALATSTLRDFNNSVNYLAQSLLIQSRSPFNYPRTRSTPQRDAGIILQKALNIVQIAGMLKGVLEAAGIQKKQTDSILADAQVMLNSTFAGQFNTSFPSLLLALQYTSKVLPGDIEKIDTWIRKNIIPLAK